MLRYLCSWFVSPLNINSFSCFIKRKENRYIVIHITSTTETAHTLTHPTLMYDIFTSTLGRLQTARCQYHTPGNNPGQSQLTHPSTLLYQQSAPVLVQSSVYSFTHRLHSDFLVTGFGPRPGFAFDCAWI